jgi:hypothetical protein
MAVTKYLSFYADRPRKQGVAKFSGLIPSPLEPFGRGLVRCLLPEKRPSPNPLPGVARRERENQTPRIFYVCTQEVGSTWKSLEILMFSDAFADNIPGEMEFVTGG